MPYLDPESYNKAEEEGASVLPNRIVECCQPYTFEYVGYPTRVPSTKALRRYVDVMHEGRLPDKFSRYLNGGISAEELDLMREVAKIVRQLTLKLYGLPMVPKDSLVSSLNIYRHLRFLFPGGNATIFEVGPGCGYLGALLSLCGYTYVSTDVTQAFYLFQNHLMNEVTPGRVIELAADSRSFADLKQVDQGWAVHVPWWKFVVPSPTFSLPVDVVTANHCLCELHPNALLYTLKAGAVQLANRGSNTCFLFETWGAPIRTPIWAASKKFADLGFCLAHNDDQATVYVRADGPLAVSSATFPRPVPRPRPRFGFIRRAAIGPSPDALFNPPHWVTPHNPISKRIMEGRSLVSQSSGLGVESYKEMLREVLGSSDILSDDEKFGRFLERDLHTGERILDSSG